ncbi:MAG: hypothetical protein ABI840_12815, partial [bacterium]
MLRCKYTVKLCISGSYKSTNFSLINSKGVIGAMQLNKGWCALLVRDKGTLLLPFAPKCLVLLHFAPEDLVGYFGAPSTSSRVELFGEVNTKPNTDLWPILSNENLDWHDADHPNLNNDYYLGSFLTDPSGSFNMSCAETQFYQDYAASSFSSTDNVINGVLWFTYTNCRDQSILRKGRNEIISQINSQINFTITNNVLNVFSEIPAS